MKSLSILFSGLVLLFVTSCSVQQAYHCPAGYQNLPDCPPKNAVNDEGIDKLYSSRTWVPPGKLNINPIELSEQANVPVNQARAKLLGPSYEDAIKSLAVKLWMIEHARFTVDVMYYIFARDPVGYAMLGALCNAVQRGVDVRIMVDSLGSFHHTHDELRALETCAEHAGFMRNQQGQITTRKARVQTIIFNAVSKFRINRRSHDKLLVVDGHSPADAVVMTGGRNISLDYYGIHKDGSRDPTAFRDLEILLRANPGDEATHTVGGVSEIYYSLLFLHKGNKRLYPIEGMDAEDAKDYDEIYAREREKAQQSLIFIKSIPEVKKQLENMPSYMRQGFSKTQVRLAHQLHNLEATDVTTNVRENVERNPNSIIYLISKLTEKSLAEGHISGTFRIVSPYLFIGLYRNKSGKVIYDGAKNLHKILRENPDLKVEIITNSVMTSDNFFTQAIIDMDMVPRLLLTPELRKQWRGKLEEGEFNPQLVESAEWKKLINNSQIAVYQTGKLDSILLGKGKTYYGKLHAKFILGSALGFIGTSNFDYRSNLYNNEMGFLVKGSEIHAGLLKIFDWLKSTSYRWGTPEWLQMRKELMEADSKKSGPARKQRTIYKSIHALGIEYLM